MFKIFNDLHPVITNAFFSVTSSSHNTRSINNFSIINFKKELCRRTLDQYTLDQLPGISLIIF